MFVFGCISKMICIQIHIKIRQRGNTTLKYSKSSNLPKYVVYISTIGYRMNFSLGKCKFNREENISYNAQVKHKIQSSNQHPKTTVYRPSLHACMCLSYPTQVTPITPSHFPKPSFHNNGQQFTSLQIPTPV